MGAAGVVAGRTGEVSLATKKAIASPGYRTFITFVTSLTRVMGVISAPVFASRVTKVNVRACAKGIACEGLGTQNVRTS